MCVQYALRMKTLYLSIIIYLLLIFIFYHNSAFAQNTNSTTPKRHMEYPPPKLTPNDNQSIVDTALSIPELQDWSHDWKYVNTAFLGNNKAGTPDFKWQYAIVNLKAPSNSAPFPCDNDWWAWVEIDMTIMKVVRATYPTMESHDCNYATGGGPGLSNISIASPLKQFKSGIASKDVTCWKGLQLIFKAEDQTPICVKPDNVKKFVSRGWAILHYHDPAAKPTIILYDYSYDGIDKDNSMVSINNQTYHQTTLSYSAYNLPKRTLASFQNVTFAFPQGSLITPGGGFLMLDMTFPDGSEEIYGGKALVQNGSATEISGIQIPTQYGPHLAANSVTVLSNHMMPQAGITIYHDKIRLLVSK